MNMNYTRKLKESMPIKIDVSVLNFLFFDTNLSWVQTRILFELYVRHLMNHKWLFTKQYGMAKHIVHLAKNYCEIKDNACVSTSCDLKKELDILHSEQYIVILMPWDIADKDGPDYSEKLKHAFDKVAKSEPCELMFVKYVKLSGESVDLLPNEKSGEFLERYKKEHQIPDKKIYSEFICPRCNKKFMKISHHPKEICNDCKKELNRLKVQSWRAKQKAEFKKQNLQDKDAANKSKD